ncbi:hypothetical protein Tdes44962_MAKER06205 [Teratosphaeria destructans]|uniref:PhoD-like phosphatase domain-containing protein n=1 Tax=Teratosphaeria destructans TaxID=418781 RepID=A0A9W7SIG2_9PEZI|nr:hypothetical protein Tdes44962_MAKER06205 [Teratosphaeria destructans]
MATHDHTFRRWSQEYQTSLPAQPYQYYVPPPPKKQTAGDDGVLRSNSKKIRDIAESVTERLQHRTGTTSDDLAKVPHASELKPEKRRQGLHINTGGDEDVPENLRVKPWSPEPDFVSPRSKTREKDRQRKASTATPYADGNRQASAGGEKPRQASNASELLRRDSVPDRSPLQRLELEFASKEEKRRRVSEAEERVRQKSLGRRGADEPLRQTTLRGEKSRVVSDQSGHRGPMEAERGSRPAHERPRHASAGASRAVEEPAPAHKKLREAQDALRDVSSSASSAGSPTSPTTRNPQDEIRQPLIPPAAHDRRESVSQAAQPQQPYHDLATARRRPQESTDAVVGSASWHDTDQGQAASTKRGDADLGRTASQKYRHRARDAGFAGAAAAVAGAGAAAYESGQTAAERGKLAHERRKTQHRAQKQDYADAVNDTGRDRGVDLGRNDSKNTQNRGGPEDAYAQLEGQRDDVYTSPQPNNAQLQQDRMGTGSKKDRAAAMLHQDPDPMPRDRVATGRNDPVNYRIPPQTQGGRDARQQVRSGTDSVDYAAVNQQGKHHKLSDLFHHHEHDRRSYQATGGVLDEWKNASIARLSASDLEVVDRPPFISARAGSTGNKNDAWWEKNNRRSSSGGHASAQSAHAQATPQYDGPYEEEAKHFRPQLFLKCGPLLRYTGLRTDPSSSSRKREVWRGSIMIVTDDRQSDYSRAPTLRIFAQPSELHIPPPQHVLDSGRPIPPEDEDPVVGQVKMSRTGRPLYVRPVHEIPGGVDLSMEENPRGLFSANRPSILGVPGSQDDNDDRPPTRVSFQDKTRVKARSGERMGKYSEVRAHRLHAERGYTFWRFNLEIELASTQRRVAYRINKGPAIGFWVPARGETMNIMFHSCNGFSMSVNPADFSGPDPLWRDVLNRHQSRPFHVMLGGGDQVYNDRVEHNSVLFKQWMEIKNPEHKHRAEFTPEMQDELEEFYLNRYAMWFSQGLFGMANGQIPMVNIWDDHDIIDGYGSYPHRFMSTRVFTGVGNVAFKYYMLFQHQSLIQETEQTEPSWLLGASPGPYIVERSRSVFMRLGRRVAFLGLDCRTERMRDEILSQETYDIVFDRIRHELGPKEGEEGRGAGQGEIAHLIVLLGVPIAYPRLNFLENILTSKMMDPVKALGRTGMLGGFVNKFDGGVEILDDLDDHWTAKHHKDERNWFVQELQDIAAETSVRITILGGDVHLGAIGQFYSKKSLGVQKDKDFRYMPNVVSSAIVNTPPPNAMADILNRRNKVHHLDDATDEDLIPMFDTDIDGRKRNNKHLLPRRNYCTIREYVPGSTPPSSPLLEPNRRDESLDNGYTMSGAIYDGQEDETTQRDRRFPPGSMKRTMSLTRGPLGLVRRLSGSIRKRNSSDSTSYPQHIRPPSAAQSQEQGGMQRANSVGGNPHSGSASFSPTGFVANDRRPSFHRRPTNLSAKEARKAAAKGGAPLDGVDDGAPPAGHINLEGGLDISLNFEVDQKDPQGETVPYRLLVPALWYDGDPEVTRPTLKGPKVSLMSRIRGQFRGNRQSYDGQYSEAGEGAEADQRRYTGEYSRSEGTITPSLEGDGHDREHVGSLSPPASRHRGGMGVPEGQYGHLRPQHNGRAISNDRSHAYNTGYNLGGPPLGPDQAQKQVFTSRQQQPQQPPTNHRRSSAPAQQLSATKPFHQPSYSSDSLDPSDNYIPQQQQQTQSMPRTRRPSKVERFFGIGDEGGPWGGGRPSMSGGQRPQTGDMEEEEWVEGGAGTIGAAKRKAGWKIWGR